jgi:hypothetical protein
MFLVTVFTPSSASAAPSYRQLVNVATERCLDSNREGKVYTLGCNGGPYQKWVGQSYGRGTFRNLATGRCLDSNREGKVYTLGCNGGPYQSWRPENRIYV